MKMLCAIEEHHLCPMKLVNYFRENIADKGTLQETVHIY